MPSPFFTSNEADITALEGLYIKERNPPASIAGINLSAVGIGGQCVRGPIGKVVAITSESRFLSVFGGRDLGAGGAIIGEVWKALLNKRFGTLYVARAAAAAAVKASFTLEDTAGGGGAQIARLDAANVGAWGNDVLFKVETASNAVSTSFDLVIKYLGNTTRYKNISFNSTDDNSLTVIGDDDANLITLTKLANGRPVNNAATVDGADADGFTNLGETVAGFTSVLGTTGSIADTDFTAAGKAIPLLSNFKGIGVVMIAGRSNTAIKNGLETEANASSDRLFLMCPDADTTSAATAITDVASYRSDRIVYCFDHPYTLDPETATAIVTEPHAWMASILSQTDVDVHPGEEDTKTFLSGISRLTTDTFSRNDYVLFKAAGISALEKDETGFLFVSGVTTSLTSGRTEITRRRSTDFLQLSIASELKFSVKKKNTAARRKANVGMIKAFLGELKRAERIVEDFSVDGEILNTPTARAQGIERILMRVRLLGHILHLVLETEIGEGVTVTEA